MCYASSSIYYSLPEDAKKYLLVAIIDSAHNLTEEFLRNTFGELSCVGNEI